MRSRMIGLVAGMGIAVTSLTVTPGATAGPSPVIPAKQQAEFVRQATAMGASPEIARRAIYDEALARGLAVSTDEEVTKVDILTPTGNEAADAELAELASACGPASASWNYRSYLKNRFGQNLGWTGIRTIVWYSDLVRVSCPNSVNWADTTGTGETVGWSNSNTLDTGNYYTYGGVSSAAYHKKVENRFRFKPAPCFCVVAQTRYGVANMWLHPGLTADASASWR